MHSYDSLRKSVLRSAALTTSQATPAVSGWWTVARRWRETGRYLRRQRRQQLAP
jgi:hypothetical protein